MTRRFLLTLCATCMTLLSAQASYHEPYTGSRIFWDQSTLQTIFPHGGYGRLIQLQDGRLMACTENGGISVVFSSADRTSWGAPVQIVSNPSGIAECVPDLIQLSDGTIIVAYNPRPQPPYSEERRFGIRLKRSTDNGKTWSEEIFVNDASHLYDDGCWEPSMLQLPSGELQLYFANEGPYTTSIEQQISLCRSFDGGRTWSTPEIVSYRRNFRDGMPVPVILADGETIAVAIEDNGWPGINNFIPTIVTCPLSVNWHDYWVDVDSPNRWQAINYSFCPKALGGAPYLRVLPWGETVLSHQSTYGEGENQMWVYVGNEKAQDFKAMTAPFSLGESGNALWNSVAVIDTGIVVAFGGINGHDDIIFGYPTRLLQAPYAKPKIDGVITRGEGYLRPEATQVMLGTKYRTRFSADFAYDEDSLYVVAKVNDNTPNNVADVLYSDGINIYVDTKNLCETFPVGGIYKVFLRADGEAWLYQGNGSTHKYDRIDGSSIRLKARQRSVSYVVEAAIPWTALGLDQAPTEQLMRMNVELYNRTSASSSTIERESLPDATSSDSWTWMEFRLQPNPDATAVDAPAWDDSVRLRTDKGWLFVESSVGVRRVEAYSTDGRLLSTATTVGRSVSMNTSYRGLGVVLITLNNGKTLSRKVVF